MKTLYDITIENLKIIDLLQESGGEITEEIEQLMTINKDNLNTKVEDYCKVIKMLDAEVKGAKAEIDRITAYKKTTEKIIERMKNRIDSAFQMMAIDELKVGTFKVNYRKSESVNIIDESLIPDDYFQVKKEVSKEAIKDAIKGGLEVSGAEILEKKNLQIR